MATPSSPTNSVAARAEMPTTTTGPRGGGGGGKAVVQRTKGPAAATVSAAAPAPAPAADADASLAPRQEHGTRGYFSSPSICGTNLFFVCEDDVWRWSTTAGDEPAWPPVRVTAEGGVSTCCASPDGRWVAYTSNQSMADEVWLVPSEGGASHQLTFLGADTSVAGWLPDSNAVLVRSDARSHHADLHQLFTVPISGSGTIVPLGLGPADAFCFGSTVGHACAKEGKFSDSGLAAAAAATGNATVVLGRYTYDPQLQEHKGYRGGRTGQLWVVAPPEGGGSGGGGGGGGGDFTHLTPLLGGLNPGHPCLGGDGRLYFVADGGVRKGRAAVLYSCCLDGTDIIAHDGAGHDDFPARRLQTDGQSLVYQCAGDIYLANIRVAEKGATAWAEPASVVPRRLDIPWRGPRLQMRPRFVPASENIGDFFLHPEGSSCALQCRGKLFEMPLWEGPAVECTIPMLYNSTKSTSATTAAAAAAAASGATATVKVAAAEYLHDGRLLLFCLQPGQTAPRLLLGPPSLEAGAVPTLVRFNRKNSVDLGRVCELLAAPSRRIVAMTDNKLRLVLLNVSSPGAATSLLVDTSTYDEGIVDLEFSQCGRWLAYSRKNGPTSSVICVVDTLAKQPEPRVVTCGRFFDRSPSFDPEGRYLYFVSTRDFTPVSGSTHFHLAFTETQRVFFITLEATAPHPLRRFPPRAPGHDSDTEGESSAEEDEEESVRPVKIDFHGIETRVGILPLKPAVYGNVVALHDSKVTYTRYPVRPACGGGGGGIEGEEAEGEGPGCGTLYYYDIRDRLEEVVCEGVANFCVSMDRSTVMLEVCEGSGGGEGGIDAAAEGDGDDGGGTEGSSELYVYAAGEVPKEEDFGFRDYGPDCGAIPVDDRVLVRVDPAAEWAAMFDDAWTVLRDDFWDPELNQVDWVAKHTLYRPLLGRVACRSEFDDVMAELVSELRCSHTYTAGGDQTDSVSTNLYHEQGHLGADTVWDPVVGGYRIEHLVIGDPWRADGGPLARVGVSVSEGDYIMAINRQPLTSERGVDFALQGMAKREVYLSVLSAAQAARVIEMARDAALVAEMSELGIAGASGSASGSGGGGASRVNIGGGDGGTGGGGTSGKQQHQQQHQQRRRRGGGGGKRRGGGGGSGGKRGGTRKSGSSGEAEDLKPFLTRVTPTASLASARYRDHVALLQSRVHSATGGSVGYVHVPDMCEGGFGEFHRLFLAECRRGALVLDVRCNAGGYVGELLLEKIVGRGLGWEVLRHAAPVSYPEHAVNGPIVLLVDENTCSDADVFAHAFSAKDLGTIVGARTWGGVVGMQTHILADGTAVAVPVAGFYSTKSCNFSLENTGVTPDVAVPFAPQDYRRGVDPQLDCAIAIAQDQLAKWTKESPVPDPVKAHAVHRASCLAGLDRA